MKLQPLGRSTPDRPAVSPKDLHVTWYEDWDAALDEALRVLPEMKDCSHGLYRALACNKIRTRKRYALVEEHGTPVAAIALRRYRHHWEPVTMWLVPGALFPTTPGYLVASLAALQTPVDVFWWRLSAPLPKDPAIRDLRAIPAYGMQLSEDIEKYWKKTGNWRNVRHNRNLCRDFTFAVDTPGAAELVVRKWAEKWAEDNPHILDHLEDRVFVSNYFAERGRYHTVLLQDKGETIAGASAYVHDHQLVAGVNFRNTDYDHYGVMSRVNDFFFHWGVEAGYSYFDIGGGPKYKRRWAPQQGERYQFSVGPFSHRILRHTLQLWRNARERLSRRRGA